MITDISTVVLEVVTEVATLAAQNGVKFDWREKALGQGCDEKEAYGTPGKDTGTQGLVGRAGPPKR